MTKTKITREREKLQIYVFSDLISVVKQRASIEGSTVTTAINNLLAAYVKGLNNQSKSE
jgi:predicted DNA binding CopG/RHH family protein